RLLLLLQSFTGYVDNLLSERAVPPAQAVGPCMSAGLTARRYWASMLKLGALYQQLLDEKKACRKEIPTLQPTPQAGKLKQQQHLKRSSPDALELRTLAEVAQTTSLCPSSGILMPDGSTSCSALPRAASNTAKSSHSTPMQTTGSPLGPCENCASAQVSLREVGKAITSICQSQNIPSALSKFQMVEESTGRKTLSATDMSYWASEQSKDLSRISRHLQTLLQQVGPLKSELEESAKQKDKLQKQVEDLSQLLQAEKETQAQQRKKAEQNLKVKNKEHLEAVARLEQDKDDLRRGASPQPGPEVSVSSSEVTKATLLEEMRTTMVTRSVALELEEKVRLLMGQRESLGEELSTTTTELEKEKVKVASMLRHQESLQAKHNVLVQQLDSLDQEHEELQARLGEAEEDKARLVEQLEESQQQSGQQLQAQQVELQANISRLEEQARELKEREKLLVFFPDLHIANGMQFESTGSLTEDMEKQLQANSIRIDLLQQENARLKSALAKVKAAAEQGVLKVRLHPSQGERVPRGRGALGTPRPPHGPW
ncbi:CC157 protein, partial [Zapornia atra]|nr:CC157 protein [Zapornia atra]